MNYLLEPEDLPVFKSLKYVVINEDELGPLLRDSEIPPWNKGLTGPGTGFYGYKHTPESIEKNRIAHLGNKYRIGKLHTEESKKKMSHWKGKTMSEEHRANIGKSQIGNKHSEETKKKMSESAKGKPKDHLKGKPRSEEVKRKIAEGQRKRHAKNKENKSDK